MSAAPAIRALCATAAAFTAATMLTITPAHAATVPTTVHAAAVSLIVAPRPPVPVERAVLRRCIVFTSPRGSRVRLCPTFGARPSVRV